MANETPNSALPRPITVLINAHSRRGRALFEPAVLALRQSGVPVGEAYAMHSRDKTVQVLQREISENAGTVIVGGGDGTLSACADELANTNTALGVLPLGTGNTFARSLGLPLRLEDAAKTIAAGHVEAVDVGRCNGQIFLNSVTLGLSAEIAAALSSQVKKKLGLLAWPVVGARVLWKHRPLHIKVVSDDRIYHHLRTHQLLVANGRYVAGPITAAPDSSVQDARLDVFVLGGAKRASLLRTTVEWLRGHHVWSEETKYFTTHALQIESLRKLLPANVDGEINDQTPLKIEVLPRALKVIVPHGFDADSV